MHAEGKLIHFAPLESLVNPPDFQYDANKYHVNIDKARDCWTALLHTSSTYTNDKLRREHLGDDYQQLFVDIVLRHVAELLASSSRPSSQPVPPLRLLLLGSAGTGKTLTVQTALQEIMKLLQSHGLPADFVRVAAPTGCAAFNLRFNATTLHRLIHHFNLFRFEDLTDERLQKL